MNAKTYIVALVLLSALLFTGATSQKALTANVAIKNFQFQPQTITVKPGTIVTWTNDQGTHTVTSDTGAFSSPTLSAGKTFSHKFTRKGTYGYHCSFHGSAGHDMAGKIIVK